MKDFENIFEFMKDIGECVCKVVLVLVFVLVECKYVVLIGVVEVVWVVCVDIIVVNEQDLEFGCNKGLIDVMMDWFKLDEDCLMGIVNSFWVIVE